GLDPASVSGTGKDGRLTKEDVMKASPAATTPAPEKAPAPSVDMTLRGPSKQGEQKRVAMNNIRKKIAERLVYSQQSTATLTTFNEIDMSRVMEIRNKYKDKFKERYGVSLGFMGFFVKATIEALKAWPAVNAFIDGTDMVYNNYYNVGVAVGTEKGLIVPVIRDADLMSVAQVEMAIRDYAIKARDGKISIDDLSGGTFTISNGGVYGSLMSTPILNPPQSGILGMHKIEERPMAINGKVEIRPMMYVALSYDHRIIDGKEAVSFLVKIKEGIEDPERLLIEI
ncbi:MAG: 2-oxoglutarate dehydrogenase complex dihydrolipoyllysine-residue succinyltransferase, partial [Pseudobdellovibrionaceae bacterium]